MRCVHRLFLAALLIQSPASTLLAGDEAGIRALLDQAGDADRHDGASQVIVYDRTRNTAEENGRTTRTREVLAKILKPEGARERSVLALGYDPRTNKIAFKRVRVFKKDGTALDVPLEPLDLPSPGGIIFWGGRRLVLPVPGLGPGDGLEIVTEKTGFNIAYLGGEDEKYVPPMRGHFYDVVRFWTDKPVLEKRYVLDAPRSKRVRFAVYNGTLRTSLDFEGDRAIYTFAAENLEPFQGEPRMVSRLDAAPKLVLATVPDWPEKSRWFWKVNEPRFEVDEGIRKKVREILAGKEAEAEKIEALVHWVAEEIRYLGLSMGEGEGYSAHPATMTFRERAGVCKDKAGLLVAMLREAGFDAFLTMTQVGSRVEKIAADQFNHAVTAVWREGGTFLLLDPTWAPASRELWSSLEQEQYVVVGTPDGERRGRAPRTPPETNRLDLVSRVEVPAPGTGGALSGRIVFETSGYPDTFLRRAIRKKPAGRAAEVFEELLDAVAPGTELRELELADPRDLSRDMRVAVSWRTDGALLAGDGALFARSPALRVLAGLPLLEAPFEAAEPGKRSHPFDLRNTLRVVFREEIAAPEGYAWRLQEGATQEKAASRDGVCYARFVVDPRAAGRTLVLRGRFEIRRKQAPATIQADFRDVMGAVKEAAERWFRMEKR